MQGVRTFVSNCSYVCLLFGLLLSAQPPVQAQEIPKTQTKVESQLPAEQQMLNQLPPEVRANMKPGIRYTVGSQTTAGWEKTLVTGNKNLGHFFWSPMTNMVQASPAKPTGAQAIAAPAQPKPEYHYAKPVHAALPQRPPEPVHVAARRTTAQAVKAQAQHSTGDLSGKIAYKKPRASEDVSADLIARDTSAKLYAPYPTADKTTQSVSGCLTHKDAYGKLLND